MQGHTYTEVLRTCRGSPADNGWAEGSGWVDAHRADGAQHPHVKCNG